MNIRELSIEFANQELTLTNQCVLYWKAENTLILSDLHLGKAAHFRKNGIAMPTQVAEHDLLRLACLLLHYQPIQVIIVGDLIHAGKNKEVDLFKAFTQKFPNTKFILIKGNHDRLPLKHLENMGISEFYQTLQIQDVYFSHQPLLEKKLACISGHIHPGIAVKLPTKQIIRFPCFVHHETELILPAFSQFTGLDTKSIPKSATCFAFYEDGIFEVS